MYNAITNKLYQIPKRKQKWLCEEIFCILDKIADSVMNIEETYSDENSKNELRNKYAKESLIGIEKLRKPLMILWVVENFDDKKMNHWCKLINDTINLLIGIIDGSYSDVDMFYKIDKDLIKDVKFLQTMYDLDVSIHSAIIKIPNKFDHSYGKMLINLTDNVLYNLVEANHIFPKNKNEYKKRRKLISSAIADLHKAQRPLTYLCIQKVIKESNIEKWSKAIDKELKLLYALNRSDKKRFKDL